MNLKRLGKGAVRFSNDVRRVAALDDRALGDVLGGQIIINCNTICGGEPCSFYSVEKCPKPA